MLGLFSLSSGFARVPHGGTTCPAVDVVPGLAGMMPSDKIKINLGYDLWSPYVYIMNGEPTGFGIEFVKLMQASSEPECQALDIEMVQDHWGRMWYDGETSCTAPLTLSQLTAHEEAKLGGPPVPECKSQNIKLGDGGIFPPAAPLSRPMGARARRSLLHALLMLSGVPRPRGSQQWHLPRWYDVHALEGRAPADGRIHQRHHHGLHAVRRTHRQAARRQARCLAPLRPVRGDDHRRGGLRADYRHARARRKPLR